MAKKTKVISTIKKSDKIKRKLILTIQTSLDGLIAEPNNGMNFLQQGVGESIQDSIENVWKQVDTILMGRIMYDGLSMFWPFQTGEFADFMNTLPKYVFSESYSEVKWGDFDNIKIIQGNIPEELQKLKNNPSNKHIILVGGAKIVQHLINLGLIDEIQIGIHPTILGAGEPLWVNINSKHHLKLIDSKIYPKSGMVLNKYDVIKN